MRDSFPMDIPQVPHFFRAPTDKYAPNALHPLSYAPILSTEYGAIVRECIHQCLVLLGLRHVSCTVGKFIQLPVLHSYTIQQVHVVANKAFPQSVFRLLL